jgi:hypothetical protein
MNEALEIHDSTLTKVEQDGSTIRLSVEAYVHRSDGQPMVDPGTG